MVDVTLSTLNKVDVWATVKLGLARGLASGCFYLAVLAVMVTASGIPSLEPLGRNVTASAVTIARYVVAWLGGLSIYGGIILPVVYFILQIFRIFPIRFKESLTSDNFVLDIIAITLRVMWGGFVSILMLTFLFMVLPGDPLIYVFNKAKPNLFRVERFGFFNFAFVLFVLKPQRGSSGQPPPPEETSGAERLAVLAAVLVSILAVAQTPDQIGWPVTLSAPTVPAPAPVEALASSEASILIDETPLSARDVEELDSEYNVLETLILGPDNAKDIWTTSVYSFTAEGGGPGGGLDNDVLRVGGWGDTYVSLMRFPTPVTKADHVGLRLYNFPNGNGPTPFVVNVIGRDWNWEPGDRLWWKDRPDWKPISATPVEVPRQGWVEVDISEWYNAVSTGAQPNYGLALTPVRTDNAFDDFASSNHPDVSKRPRLMYYKPSL